MRATVQGNARVRVTCGTFDQLAVMALQRCQREIVIRLSSGDLGVLGAVTSGAIRISVTGAIPEQ
jgi:precorrin-4 methylase